VPPDDLVVGRGAELDDVGDGLARDGDLDGLALAPPRVLRVLSDGAVARALVGADRVARVRVLDEPLERGPAAVLLGAACPARSK